MNIPLNEIKKALYKEKPIAQIDFVSKTGVTYLCCIDSLSICIVFRVPFEDIQDGVFNHQIGGQLLIRWLSIS